MDDFVEFCDGMFEAWLDDRLGNGAYGASEQVCQFFKLDYAPEPYLLYGGEAASLGFLTCNPGQPLPFQRYDVVKAAAHGDIRAKTPFTSPIYAENARTVGAYYAGDVADGANSIGNAQRRIKSMRELQTALGLQGDGIRHFELYPFHSRHGPQGQHVDALGAERPIAAYQERLRAALAEMEIVVGICGPSSTEPHHYSPLMRRFLHLLGMTGADISLHIFRQNHAGQPTSFVIYQAQAGGAVRAVTSVSAANVLPGRQYRDELARSLLKARGSI